MALHKEMNFSRQEMLLNLKSKQTLQITSASMSNKIFYPTGSAE